jgi:hypothetical protein
MLIPELQIYKFRSRKFLSASQLLDHCAYPTDKIMESILR